MRERSHHPVTLHFRKPVEQSSFRLSFFTDFFFFLLLISGSVPSFFPSDWFVIVPKIPLQNSLSRNQWLSNWVCISYLNCDCGNYCWLKRLAVKIGFLGSFLRKFKHVFWCVLFDLFHVLTINALGCHLNFKLIFYFLVYEYWYRGNFFWQWIRESEAKVT